jgi:hypothetical protein
MATTYNLPKPASHWKIIGSLFGVFGGLLSPVIGAVITVISWFADPAWHGLSLHIVATSLFVITFPLLLFGAHCMDLLDKD